MTRIYYFSCIILFTLCFAACSSNPQHVTIAEHSSQNQDILARSSLARSTHTHQKSPSTAASQPVLINAAKQYLGTTYRYGGNSYDGIDCSGLVVNSFQKVGIKLPRTSRAQANQGTQIPKGHIRPGDLVFFSTHGARSQINHVGIMVDKHAFIHASSSRGVIISKLSNAYWKPRYLFAKRIAN